MSQENKINTEEAKAIAILLLVVFALILLTKASKGIGKFLNKITGGESEEEKANKQFGQNSMWNPNTWKKAVKGTLLLKREQAKKFAADIANAWGIFNDDEEAIYNVFRQLKTKAQVSEVADFYQLKTGSDLYGDLYSKLSDSELSTINSMLVNLK